MKTFLCLRSSYQIYEGNFLFKIFQKKRYFLPKKKVKTYVCFKKSYNIENEFLLPPRRLGLVINSMNSIDYFYVFPSSVSCKHRVNKKSSWSVEKTHHVNFQFYEISSKIDSLFKIQVRNFLSK